MSLHDAAQHLASKGRLGDSMLVHMNPQEVADLQKLAEQRGTSLTINPKTGLPEALSLGDFNPVRVVQGKGAIGEALGPAAPILAGVALGPAGFGLMGAGAAGLTVGGITALASGNLQKGLMAGLGAYGGAALSGGLMGMGEAALGDAAKAETLLGGGSEAMAAENAALYGKEAPLLDKLGAGSSYAAQNPKAALAALGEGSAWKGAGILGAAAAPVLAGQMVQTATPAPSQSQGLIRPYDFNRKVITPTDMVSASFQPGQSTRERNWFEDTYTALPTYKSPGPEYKAEGGEIVDDGEPVVRMAFGGILDSVANAVKEIKPAVSTPKYEGLPSYNYNPETQSFTRDYGVGPAPVRAKDGDFGSGGGMFGGFFSSGLRSLINDINYGVAKKNYEQKLGEAIDKDPNFVARKKMGQYAFDPQTQSFSQIDPDALKASMIATATPAPTDTAGATGPQVPFDIGFGFAGGGLPSLGGYASGGNPRLLKGPGDGMSDNIPAVIGGKQPARLADGEFVVPADVVSHLGNGSTEAGAKQLYKMMDRIRQQRTGKKRQAPQVNPAKAMPA